MLLYLIFILVGIGLDQLSKLYAVHSLAKVTTVPIIPNVFHLTYIENDGAAFSILSGKQTFLIIITIIAMLLIGFLLFTIPKKKKYLSTNIALTMILAGAIGNLIDRIRLGYVIDFFDFRLIGFAIFNIADCFVVIGCILLVISIWRNHFPASKAELNIPGKKTKNAAPPASKKTTGTAAKSKPQKQAVKTPSKAPKKTAKAPAKISKKNPLLSDNPKSVRFDPTPPEKEKH